jgi:hypothetical protein
VLALLGEAAELAPARVAAGHGRQRPFESLGVAVQHLGDPEHVVEAHERVGDDEAALRQARPFVGQLDGRLQARDPVVADVADDRHAERLRLVQVDEPRAGADERVAAEPSVLDRLEQE